MRVGQGGGTAEALVNETTTHLVGQHFVATQKYQGRVYLDRLVIPLSSDLVVRCRMLWLRSGASRRFSYHRSLVSFFTHAVTALIFLYFPETTRLEFFLTPYRITQT